MAALRFIITAVQAYFALMSVLPKKAWHKTKHVCKRKPKTVEVEPVPVAEDKKNA